MYASMGKVDDETQDVIMEKSINGCIDHDYF